MITSPQLASPSQLRCNQGYTLLSCGLQQLQSASPDYNQFAIPVNPNTCACYNYNGVKCLAWCSSVVRNFQIVESVGVQTGVIRAKCPPDKSVIGCHVLPYQVSSFDYDAHQEHYPPDEGCGCICSNRIGAKCYATCASNVRNYVVMNETSSGTFHVECPAPSAVFGSGVSFGPNGNADGKSEAFVFNSTTCQCYDKYGMTCYAMCGQLY